MSKPSKQEMQNFLVQGDEKEVRRFLKGSMSENKLNAFMAKRQPNGRANKKSTEDSKD